MILNQMKYLFDTNSQLISIVKELHSKYEGISKINVENNENLKVEIHKVENQFKSMANEKKTFQENINNKVNLNENTELVSSLQEKISQLEQNSVNSCIILQGSKIDEVVRHCETNSLNINLQLKNYLSTILHHDDHHLIDEISNIKTYGRHLKFLHIQLSNTNNKKQLIIKIKKERPANECVSEFLIQSRLKLYHQLRLHAKVNKDKIEQVFTRNGNM